MNRGESPGREHGSAQRKRERKNRVLPLDHLQRHAQIVQDRHGSIVMQAPEAVFYFRLPRDPIVRQRLTARSGTVLDIWLRFVHSLWKPIAIAVSHRHRPE